MFRPDVPAAGDEVLAEAEAEPLLPTEGPNSTKAWKGRIDESDELIKFHRTQWTWTTNVDRFVGKGGDDAAWKPTGAALLPKDYAYTEQKKPLLFYQLPEVMLTPARDDVTVETAQLFAAILNDLVGPSKINALPTINEVLSDILVPAGVGLVEIGYETFIDPNEPEVAVPDPTKPPVPVTDEQGIPQIDPTTGMPQMQPATDLVPNVVAEKYFCERISPLDFRYDAGFRGSDWAKCPWTGYRFRMAPHRAAVTFNVDPKRLAAKSTDSVTPTAEQSLSPDRSKQKFSGVEGIRIYYRCVDFDDKCGDPDLFMCLVFLDGLDEPVMHEPARTQVVEGGRVVRGLRRSPIYPLTLRYASDMPTPPSDCAMSRVIVDELSVGRTQMWQQRDRNVPLRGLDVTKVTPDSKEAIRTGKWQEIIQFENVDNSQSPIFGIPQSAYPQENFNFNNIGERDLQECWALSGSNLGTPETSGRTATELSIRQQGTETRMASEQARCELWWIAIVEGLGALVQEFADLPQYARVVGEKGAQTIVEWTKQQIAGEFAFTFRPDSAKRIDQTAERKFRLDAMNLMINIPGINQGELIKWAAPALGLDPAKVFTPPQPQPEKPKVSIAIATASLSPLSPEYANVVTLLGQFGINLAPPAPVDPNAQPGAPPPPGGDVTAGAGAPPVNKHQADQTGMLPGGGSATPATVQ